MSNLSSAQRDHVLHRAVSRRDEAKRVGVEDAYVAYFDDLRRFIQRRLGDRERAVEIAQDVYVDLLRAYEQLDQTRSLRPWLLVVAQRRIADELDARRRLAECVEKMKVRPPEPRSDVYHRLLYAVFEALPVTQREIAFRRIVLEEPYEHIGCRLERSSGACRSGFSRSVRVLQESAELHS